MVMLLGFLLIAEGLSRPFATWTPAWRAGDNPGVLMVGHPTRLWGAGPGIRSNGPASTATITDKGLRAPDPTVPRPPGRERILVLGDSTFFGHGVADDETLGQQLQAELQGRGFDVDSANGAIAGYSTEQTRLLLDEVGWSLEPTLLLIGSLWSDNNSDGFRDMDLLRTVQLGQQNPLSKSAFFQVMVSTVDRLRGGEGAQLITWPKDGSFPSEGVRRVPVQRYAENLDAMVRDARARGVGVVFVAPCNQGLVDGLYQTGAAWDPYFSTMAAVAAHEQVPHVRALDALQAAGEPTASLFVDVLHPNARGFALIARKIADTLVAAGWPEQRLTGQAPTPFPAELVVDTARNFVMVSDASSPQSWLFPGRMPSGHGDGVGAPGVDQPWILTGRVVGTGPVEVTVKEGDTLLTTRSMAEPGWFEVPLSPSIRLVSVTVSGPGGHASAEVSFDVPGVTLELKP